MKALVLEEPYHIRLRDVDLPILEDGEALIKVLSVAICGSDIHAYKGEQAIFSYPRIMGHEVCGRIEKIQGGSGNFCVGDRVIVMPYVNCKACIACRKRKPGCCENLRVMGVHTDGAMAEYCKAKEEYLIKVDDTIEAQTACLIEPLAISAHAVANSKLQKGENILIIGCGPIGIGAAEIAKTYDAKVILADTSGERREIAKSRFGYEHVLNPLDSEYRKALEELTGKDMPDVIIDSTGNAESMSGVFEYLSYGGRVVYVGIDSRTLSIKHVEFHKRQTELYGSRAATKEDFEYVMDCIAKGKVDPKRFITDHMRFNSEIQEQFEKAVEKGIKIFKGVINFEEE